VDVLGRGFDAIDFQMKEEDIARGELDRDFFG
jgi:hypothetical protein